MANTDLPTEPPSSEVTPEPLYNARREFIRNAGLFALSAGAIGTGLTWLSGQSRPKSALTKPIGGIVKHLEMAGGEEQSTWDSATTYNNYYEFGTDKSDPAKHAISFKSEPWTVAIEGEVGKPQTVDIDTLIKWAPLEERVYRMRCVEAWSMVIPWVGLALSAILKRVEPTSKAKYVAFRTLLDSSQMPSQRRRILQWPYSEGLRMDEAMHPLTLLAVGMYGRVLPNQNGAPLRLVVPWKYGFKGIKAIVKIRLSATQPLSTWNSQAPGEYGFYANVNPHVDHPRWSQATERRIGEWTRRNTLPFNGYAEQVAGLYNDMDLRANF
jgi:sulfoxide reductase catalytic subunit YedY